MAAKRSKAGRKSGGVNKAESIRQMFRQLGSRARNRDVIAKLHEQSIEVSAAQVSNVKSSMGRRKKTKTVPRQARVRAAAANDMISLSTLMAAKRLAESVGGIEPLRQAIEALGKLS